MIDVRDLGLDVKYHFVDLIVGDAPLRVPYVGYLAGCDL